MTRRRSIAAVEIPASRVRRQPVDIAVIGVILTLLRPFGYGDIVKILKVVASYFDLRVERQ